EARLRLALRSAKSGTWDWDFPTGKLVWSPEFFELLGLSPDVPPSFETWLATLHPDDRKPSMEKIDQSVQDHKELWNEYRVLLPDGGLRWIGAAGSTSYNDKGEPLRMSGICIDISERKQAEEALRESEQRFHSMFESHDSVMLLINPETGEIIDANQAAERFYGSSHEAFCQQTIQEINILTPEEVSREMQKAIHEKNNFFIFPHRLANGEIRTVEVHSSPIEMGGKTILFSIINDITDRKLAEDALRESEELLRDIIEKNPMSIQIVDREGFTLRVNPAFIRLFGSVPPPDFSIITDLVKSYPELENHISRVKSGEPVNLPDMSFNPHDIYPELPDVPTRVRAIIFPLNDRHGNPQRFVFMHEDITERKRAEETLQQSEEWYRSILQTTMDGFWVIDISDGRVMEVNETYCRMLGYPRDELLTLHIPEIDALLTPARQAEIIRDVIASGSAVFETRHLRKDGSVFDVEISVTYLNRDGGRLICFCRDITERKLREETHAFLVQSGYPGSGEDFFNSLARYLAEHLNMDYVCIDTLEGDGLTAQTVAVYNDGKFDINVRYALKDTPCGVVVGKTICCFSDEVCRLFPNDPALQDLGARSYIGTTLWSSEGKPIGLIALIRRKPLQNPEMAKVVLDMVTMRAAGELERRLGERALQESEEKYRMYIDHSPEGIFIVDEDGNYTDVNPSACFMLGYSCEEVLVRSIRDMVPPDHLASSLSRFSKLKETGMLMAESLLIKKNGDLLPVILNAVNMPDGKYLGFCTDITEQKRAEGMLRTLTTHLIHAQKIGHVGSFDFNIPENKVIWSEEMFRIFGQEPQASPLSIEQVRKMIHPDDRELQREQTEKIMETGSYEFEHRLIRPDGDIRWIAGRAEMVEYDAANAPVRMLGTMQDITDRKRFEEAIRESRQILDTIIKTIPARVFWKDKDLTFLGCNTQFARDAGFEKPEDVIGKDDYTMGWCEQAELYRADDRLVIESGRPRLLIEEPQTTPSGEKISLLTSKVPLKNATGEIIGVLGTYLDITERKRAEEELQRTNKKLNLLSSITRHDITNQLTVLMGYLTVLEKKQPDPTLSEYFSKVKTTAERISSMIRFTQEYEAIGVNAPAWQECRTLVDTAVKQALLGKVMVKNDIPAGTEIFADPLVMKVFYNLMDNAVQYGGKITKIRFCVEESGDDHIVACEDDGEGIRADEKEMIFERGYGKNTGLGLALSREILSITGITIKETGEPGKGARFEIVVPKEAWRRNH
ncbi:MAG: PAS domain S-box protein, partial [Methanomicrobiales archaeon]